MKRALCCHCQQAQATLKRPRNGTLLCNACFYQLFEEEIHETIVTDKMFTAGDRVVLGASGGKDSTVLIHVMKTLNERHNYNINLELLSIDEGIRGYRDDSLVTVHRNRDVYDLPLTVLSYKDLYGWTMDEIVANIGTKSNCTYCGVFRRQALNKGAAVLKATKVATGHNADDIAETVLMNLLRADVPRLARCVNSVTSSAHGGPDAGGDADDEAVPRVKPFKYAYEKEIVLYAHHKKLDYFTTECTYSTEAFRGNARVLLKDLERLRPRCIVDTIASGEAIAEKLKSMACSQPASKEGKCEQCGYVTSQKLCRACVLLGTLNRGRPKVVLS